MRYFLLYTGRDIELPEAALDIYERVDTYRSWNGDPQYGAASIGAKVRVRTLVERFDTERYSDLFSAK